MQTPVTPGGAADAFYGWTVIQLILMGAAALLVIAGMIYGRRLAHQRHRAQAAAEERAEEAGVEVPPAPSEAIPEAEVTPTTAADPDLPAVAVDETGAGTARDPGYELAPAEPVELPEPAVTAVEPAPEPSPEPAPAVEPEIAGALALTTIKGLGPKVAAMMAERGITRVDQVAALDADAAAALDAQLGAFAGRMARDRWIDQARLLASGDTAAYEAEFGKLG